MNRNCNKQQFISISNCEIATCANFRWKVSLPSTILPMPNTAYMSEHRAGAGCGLRNASYLWPTLLTCYGFCGILWSLARQCKWANCLQSCVSLDTNCLTLHFSYVLLTWAAVSASGHGAHVPRVKLYPGLLSVLSIDSINNIFSVTA